MNKKSLFISISAVIIILLILLYKYEYKSLTYEEFFNKTNNLINELSNKYTRINKKDYVFAVPYYGNVDGKWSSDKGDIIGNDPSKPKKNIVYFINDSKNVITKLGFYYSPKIQQKEYFSVNIVDNMTNEFLIDNYELPIIYNANFTDNNMFIQITSFAIYPNISHKNDEEVSKVLRTITIDTQNLLLGKSLD
ncbi:hypothetical protein [Abyssisolibacter fermentans]|uniref:hypothetical protein n=1 Tax=Abyssisolibacter fermentans TaxID=1766203 RepID=UPI00082D7D68|nr:hypothetical protein [Abyssisolibacter fermentans]